MEEKKNIVIVLQQYSIVVRGVERKLKELGYNVSIMEPDIDLIKDSAPLIDLFVFYLPKDSKNREEDEQKFNMLTQICDVIQSYNKNMVLIGEKSYRSSLMDFCPVLRDCEWLDRPVDMKQLSQAIERALTSDGQPKVRKHILIVDNDPAYASMVRTWIKEFYDVDILTAGKQTLSFLIKKKVDLVLLDYEMPVMNGPEVLQMLRQELSEVLPPIVFLTGVSTPDEVKKVLALKPDGYVLKSKTREQLLEYLEEKLK
ncbi:MAG: response regulator [Selenomonadaceae bacterium]|nr:response regulator [Selenomonadaceae bacterium]